LISGLASAQSSRGCSRQTEHGSQSKARTKVTRQLNGCALREQGEGEVLFFWEGMTKSELLKGLSVRSFNERIRQWNIQWMDSRNPQFVSFVGNFVDGTGEFFRTARTSNTTRIMEMTKKR
jgi:hypothetical protein